MLQLLGVGLQWIGELGVAVHELWAGRRKGVTVHEDEFTFRRFGPEHVRLMHEWLQRPHVAEGWGTLPSVDEIREHYLHDAKVDPYIVYRAGEPIAFIQSYVAMNSGDGWWPDERDPGVVGIDQFIAVPELLNKGVGTAMIRAFVARLLADPAVTKIQTDPSPKNHRAIRCYEKVGFMNIGVIETPDGPAWYMVYPKVVTR
jgi:RimJ/RimL family protein N-acetyltransferase